MWTRSHNRYITINIIFSKNYKLNKIYLFDVLYNLKTSLLSGASCGVGV